MKKIILIAGYTKTTYVTKLRAYFPPEDYVFACAYSRTPLSEVKQKYLRHFDILFDLTIPKDRERLSLHASDILCVTCTQERDMLAYIETLTSVEIITANEADLYTTAINKKAFKESLGAVHPELVPEHHEITTDPTEIAHSLAYPQVVKPTGLAGSLMVRVVHSATELLDYYQTFAEHIHSLAKEFYIKDVSIITEEFLNGPQYSVNVYIDAAGEVTFCPLVRVITPQELELNDTYSVYQYLTDELTDEQHSQLKAAVQTTVKHFKLKNTSAHFDSVLQNEQWKFFEIGLRIGGNRQKLYEHSHGMDHIYNDVLNRLGQKVIIPEQKNEVCIVQKGSLEEGYLDAINFTRTVSVSKSAHVLEDKLAKIGELVKPVSLGGGTITRHFVVGKDFENVLETSQKVFADTIFDITEDTSN